MTATHPGNLVLKEQNRAWAFRRASRWLTVLALSAVVAACGGDDEAPVAAEEVQVVIPDRAFGCPDVSILADAAEAMTFDGAGRDPTNLVWRTAVGEFRGGCEYDETDVLVEVEVDFVAERGPRLQGDSIPFEYFVAILDPDDRILARESFTSVIEFDGDSQVGGTTEVLEQVIPLSRRAAGPSYQILLGLQLTRDQVDYNRRRQLR